MKPAYKKFELLKIKILLIYEISSTFILTGVDPPIKLTFDKNKKE